MAEITAGMVKALREKTDAPMMECKKALSEAAGDMDRAEELLRVKLGNKASKAASRVTAEGIVGIVIEGRVDGQSEFCFAGFSRLDARIDRRAALAKQDGKAQRKHHAPVCSFVQFGQKFFQ